MAKSRQISARLKPETAYKLKRIIEATGSNMSDVISRSIEAYFQQMESLHERGWEALSEVGFVGCADGEAELSEHYKRQLIESLAHKA